MPEQGTFEDGTHWTIGWCRDPKYQGLMFVSIGDSWNHTTYIVHPHNATISNVKRRGTDKTAWFTVCVAILAWFENP